MCLKEKILTLCFKQQKKYNLPAQVGCGISSILTGRTRKTIFMYYHVQINYFNSDSGEMTLKYGTRELGNSGSRE